jgi:hypothetical protein
MAENSNIHTISLEFSNQSKRSITIALCLCMLTHSCTFPVAQLLSILFDIRLTHLLLLPIYIHSLLCDVYFLVKIYSFPSFRMRDTWPLS